MQKVHDIEALLLAQLDGMEVAQWWLATANRAGAWRSMEQRQRRLHGGEMEAGRQRRRYKAGAHVGRRL
jgi:hypothetical protein